jgi:hypothetical protein
MECMAYYYKPETGYYGADMKNTAVAYTRGGTLTRIDYGMTNSTVYSATAPEQVVFSADTERCFAGLPAGNTCADSQTTTHPEYWPDTPVDLNCTSGSNCTMHGVSFWSRKRAISSDGSGHGWGCNDIGHRSYGRGRQGEGRKPTAPRSSQRPRNTTGQATTSRNLIRASNGQQSLHEQPNMRRLGVNGRAVFDHNQIVAGLPAGREPCQSMDSLSCRESRACVPARVPLRMASYA